METLKSALHLITPNAWLASIDLVSAYHTVSVYPKHRKYLKFLWNGKLYQYNCLPNGLSQAPRCFTKLTKPIYARLRGQGHISTGYLDDSLLIGTTFEECEKNVAATKELFQSLGFVVHVKKSVLLPAQTLTYLGVVIDTQTMTIQLTRERKEKLITSCNKILENRLNSIQTIASLIGQMVSSFIAVPHGPLFYRQLEKEKTDALKKCGWDWKKKIELSIQSIEEIVWWRNHIHTAVSPIAQKEPDMVLHSDASRSGWGGCVCNDMRCGGAWSLTESKYHINELELLSAYMTVKAFTKEKVGIHVRIFIDNTVAMTCINKMGTSKSPMLNDLTIKIWAECMDKDIWLSAVHIKGKDNSEADFESRNINLDTEWKINSELLNFALTKYQWVANIDLFASRLNNQREK